MNEASKASGRLEEELEKRKSKRFLRIRICLYNKY